MSLSIPTIYANGYKMQYENGCIFVNNYPRMYSSAMTIGERLDKAMKLRGFKSQQALAKESGVPQATISRILSNSGTKGPETETLRKLAHACRVTFESLVKQGDGDFKLLPPPLTLIKTPDDLADEILKIAELYRWSTLKARELLMDSAQDAEKLPEFTNLRKDKELGR